MPRKALGPRLYLDPARKQWIIRDGTKFIRTGAPEESNQQAKVFLAEYKSGLPKPKTQECVYFIRCGRMIKIGRAMDVQKRLDVLQRNSAKKIKLLWAQPGGSQLEAKYHRDFKNCRSHGEWFEIKGGLEAFLLSLGFKK